MLAFPQIKLIVASLEAVKSLAINISDVRLVKLKALRKEIEDFKRKCHIGKETSQENKTVFHDARKIRVKVENDRKFSPGNFVVVCLVLMKVNLSCSDTDSCCQQNGTHRMCCKSQSARAFGISSISIPRSRNLFPIDIQKLDSLICQRDRI